MSIESNTSKPEHLAAGENPARVFPWFRLACAFWIAVTVSLVFLFIVGIPQAYQHFLDLQFTTRSAAQLVEPPTPGALVISASAYAMVEIGVRTVPNLLSVIVGIILFIRKVLPARGQADEPWNLWGLSFLLILIGTNGGNVIGGTVNIPFSDPLLIQLVRFISTGSTLAYPMFCYMFPDGRFVPSWTRWAALIFLVVAFLTEYTEWFSTYNWLFAPLLITFFYAPLIRYRRAGAVQRLQMKWALLGMLAIPAGWFSGGLITAFFSTTTVAALKDPAVEFFFRLAQSQLYLILPVGIGIAILRSRLWGIDTIIRRALIYSILTGLLGLVYFGSVVLLQSLFGRMAGDQGPLVIALSTLLSAALFTPLRKRIQAFIDYRFFRTKYDASQTLLAFSQTARNEVNIESLRDTLLRVVTETVHPASLSLWIRQAEKSRHFIDTISPDSLASSISAGEGQKS